jgi:hypothetical protein
MPIKTKSRAEKSLRDRAVQLKKEIGNIDLKIQNLQIHRSGLVKGYNRIIVDLKLAENLNNDQFNEMILRESDNWIGQKS